MLNEKLNEKTFPVMPKNHRNGDTIANSYSMNSKSWRNFDKPEQAHYIGRLDIVRPHIPGADGAGSDITGRKQARYPKAQEQTNCSTHYCSTHYRTNLRNWASHGAQREQFDRLRPNLRDLTSSSTEHGTDPSDHSWSSTGIPKHAKTVLPTYLCRTRLFATCLWTSQGISELDC